MTSAFEVDSSPRRQPWALPLVLLAAALLLLVRKPDSFFHPQLWAEDGAIFLAQQQDRGLQSLLLSHGGYFHTVQRLVALAAGAFAVPLEYIPAFYNLAAAALLLCAVAFVFTCRMEFPPRWRWLIALAPVLVPHTGEVLVVLTNVHFVLAPAVALLILQRPPTTRGRALVEVALLGLLGLTGPFIVVFLPLFVYRLALYARTWSNLLFVAVGAGCAIVQATCASYTLESVPPATTEPFRWAAALGYRLPSAFYFGWLAKSVPHLLVVGVGILLAAWLVYGLCRLPAGSLRRYGWLFLICGLGMYVAGLQRVRSDPLVIDPLVTGPRYFFIPAVFLLWLHVLVLARAQGRFARMGGAVGLGLMAVASATQFFAPPLPDLQWREQVRLLRSVPGVSRRVPINPPGWYASLKAPPRP